jgi:hypothetical protein
MRPASAGFNARGAEFTLGAGIRRRLALGPGAGEAFSYRLSFLVVHVAELIRDRLGDPTISSVRSCSRNFQPKI